nr:glycoside-pentoside-hexuronide (GPH):cation symporter [Ohessyouella blattaphilus]
MTRGQRFTYALGDFGYNFMYYWLSTYLMIYYTDTIGISAGTVSIMMLVVRIFDAINDPFIGSLADRTKTRWGRYRPWFLVGSLAMATCIVLVFAAKAEWTYTNRVLWMWGIYLLLTVASTCSNMPYGALNACITPDSEDRAKLSGLRMMFANVSSMVTVIIAVPLIRFFATDGSATDERGYFYAVLITCLLGIPTMIICAVKTKEVVTPPPSQKTIPMKAQMNSLVKNKPVMILVMGQLIQGCVLYGRAAMLAYYWQYNVGNPGFATTYGWVSLVAAIIGTGWLGNFLFKKMQHKGRVCATLNFMTAAAYGLMYFVQPPALSFWVLTFFGSMSFYAYMGVHFGAIGDAVDYGEYVAGVRCDGFLSSFISVANKAGGAILPAIGAAVLASLNYVANGEQTATVLTAINCFITVIPAVLSLISGIFYLKYPISTKEHKKIITELIDRRTVVNS